MKDNYNSVPDDNEYVPKHVCKESDNVKKEQEKIYDDSVSYNKCNNIDFINNNEVNNFFYDNNKEEFNNKETLSKSKKKKIKNWGWNILFVIFFLIIIISIVKIVIWVNDNKNTSKVFDKIKAITEVEEKEDDNNTELINAEEDKNSDYWYYVTFPLIDVDITKLKEKNSDTVGWINVNNTNINYPYVQSEDNSYYLTHSFDKSYNEAGWVFLDYRNNSSLSDKNNIIYAHSRLDKTMFGSLSKVLKSKWYSNKDNHIIRISTEYENTMWQIFSVYKIPEESYYISTSFSSDNDYEKFLNKLKDRSIYDFNTSLSKDDRIITLSTCYSDKERTVVHAKLIKRSSR